jgi:2-methylaconitate cis-trans-isomerase PrpF
MTQRTFPVVFMRGGTSKGLYFHKRDLPDRAEWDALFCGAMGSPDPYGRQLDGMGGGISSLSKVMIVERSARPGVDVDYTFGQVEVDRPRVDWKGNCGNLTSGIAPFAVDEGIVPTSGDQARVTLYNTNTQKTVVAQFALEDGKAKVIGDFALQGVAGLGARIRLDFLEPGGAGTGKLLPTGNTVDRLTLTDGSTIEGSIVDAANPVVFVRAAEVGAQGTELPEQLSADRALLARLEAIRCAAAVAMGLAKDAEDATTRMKSIPKVAMVTRPADAALLDRSTLAADRVDLLVRTISMGVPHNAVPLTGGMCAAVAASIAGTIANEATRGGALRAESIRVGHPSGLLEVAAKVERGNEWHARYATVFRTARRLMKGEVYIPG